MSLDKHQTHDKIFADVLRLGQTDPLHQPSLFFLAVLQELEKLQRPFQGRPPRLGQVVDAAKQHSKTDDFKWQPYKQDYLTNDKKRCAN